LRLLQTGSISTEISFLPPLQPSPEKLPEQDDEPVICWVSLMIYQPSIFLFL
jgi:hypothetical protein